MKNRLFVALCVVAMATTFLVIAGADGPDAAAQQYDPQSIRYQANARGDIDFVGNTLLTCPTASAGCTTAQNAGTGAAANNQFAMVNVDQDGLGTNSSVSTLTLPPGASVLFAGLYWGANSSAGNRNQVSFRTPTTGYQTVTASTLDSDGGPNYQGFYDATAEVQAAGNGTYAVGNVAARTGTNAHAGWSMMVVYEDTSLPFRNLTVYDGFARINSANPVQITVGGFLTPVTGPVTAKVTNVVYEGDDRYSGDQIRFEGNVLGDGAHPAGNFFNGRISKDGVLFNDKAPNYVDQLGFDIARTDVTGLLANSQTSATIDYSSEGDWYYVGVVATAIDIFVPDLETALDKTFIDLNGGDVVPGDVIEYRIASENLGQDPAVNLLLTDALPPGTTYVPGSLQIVSHPSPSLDGTSPTDAVDGDGGEFTGDVVFDLDTIGIAETFEVAFQVEVDSGTEFSTIENEAVLTYQGATLPVDYTNSDVAEFEVVAAADLVLESKVDTVDPVTAGESFDYIITVRNDGPSPSVAPVLTDALPAGLAFVSGAGCVAGPPVSCTLADLAPGTSTSVTITVTADPSASATTLTNTASVSSQTTPDPDLTNNNGSETTEIVRSTDLSITKVDTTDPILAGNDITYTLTVTNAGPSTATSTMVTEVLPTGTTLVSALPDNGATCSGTSVVTCDLGELDPLEVVTITVVATTAIDLVDSTTLTNTASASTTTPDSDPTNNSDSEDTVVNRLADLVLDKTGPATINAGELISYTITATNNGPSISQNAEIVDTLPTGFVFDAATSTPGCTLTTPPSEVTCPVGDLVPGAAGAASVTISALVPASTPPTAGVLNSAVVTDDDGNTAAASHPVDITREVDLNIAKSDLADPAVAGDVLSYVIVVGNDGPSDASSVQILDTLPAEVTFSSAVFDPAGDGSCSGGAVVTCTPAGGVLAAGGTATINVDVLVPADLAPGTLLTNTATITSTEDPVGATAVEETGTFNEINLTIGKVATPNPVIAGETVTYTITFNNAGPSDAQAPEILDTLPGEVSFVSAAFSAAADGSCVHDGAGLGGVVTCTPTTLLDEQTVTVTIVGTVASDTPDDTDITNDVTGSATDPANPGERISVDADAVVNVQREADLSATKIVSPNPVLAGQNVTYTINIDNAGPSDASGILALDPLPLGLTVVTPLPAGCTDNAGTINCDVGELAVGTGTSFNLTATIDPSADQGTDQFPNTVSVTGDEPDPNPDNNTDTVAVDVENEVALTIVKVDNIDPVIAGETVVYSIEVGNDGPSDANAVTVSDTPPAGLTFDQAASSTGCVFNDPTIDCAVGTIAPAESATVNLVFTVDSGATAGTVTNSATVVSDEDPTGVSATEETTIETRADLAVVKTAAPSPAVPGTALTYTVVVENKGPSDAIAATVEDVLPASLIFGSVTPASCSHDGAGTGGIVSCALGDLAPTDTVTITIVANIDPAATGDVVNTATAASDTTDPNADNDESTATTPLLPQADVSIIKTDSADPVTAGLGLTYTLTATNAGPSTAANITIIDTLPSQVSFVGAPGCSHTGEAFGGTVTCIVTTLAAGNSVPFTISTSVDPNTVATLAMNSVEITADTQDPNAANDSDTESTAIEATADLDLAKSVTPNPVLAGQQAVYSISVSNAGPSAAQAVNVNDQLPAGVSFVSSTVVAGPATCTGVPGDGGTVGCGFGTLAPGDSRTVEILVDVLSGASGTLTNTAVASSPTDPNPPSASAPLTVQTAADLVMTDKSDNVDPAIAGQGLVWTLSIRNDGPSDAVNSTITDALPAGVTYNPATSTPSCGIAGGVVTCPTGTLAPGDTATVNIGVTIDPATTGSIANTGASTQSDTNDPDPDNNSQSESTAIETQSQVTALKTASPDPVVAGENLIYEITVNNEGPSTAVDAVLTDPLPAGTTLVAASSVPAAGGCSEPAVGLVSCDLATLAVNSPVVVTIEVETSAALLDGAALQNTATVNWLDGGPTTAPASSSVIREADLGITKTGREDVVAAGANVVWDVTVTNDGSSDATNVVITDTLPANTTFNAALSSGECVAVGADVVCNLASLEADGSAALVIAATVDSAVPPGTTLTNSIAVEADEDDPNPLNDQTTEDTTVEQVTDLSIVKTDSPDPITAGEALTWIVTVTNNGPSDASGVEIEDALPTGVTFVAFGPAPSSDPDCVEAAGIVTCELAAIAAGDSVDVSIVGAVDAGAPAGSIVLNEVEISAFDGTDPNPLNNSDDEPTSVQRQAGIVLSKTAQPAPVVAGQDITYVLRLQNDGPSDGSGVLIEDVIPADTSFVSVAVLATGQAATCTETLGTVLCTPDAAGATLANGDFIEVEIVVTTNSALDAGATVANTATAQSTDVPPDFPPVEAQATTPVSRLADVALDKAVDPATVIAGESVTYTLTASNAGPSDATGVTVGDILPQGVTFVSSAEGCTSSGPSVSCSVAVLPAGDNAVFTFVADVAPTLADGESFVNNAVVSATEPDPDPDNNGASATADVEREADLAITKTDNDAEVIAGESVTYAIEVTNNGPSQATGVVVTDAVPAGTSFDPSGSTSSCVETDGVVTCDLADVLELDESATVIVAFAVDDDIPAGSTITNVAQVAANEDDPTPNEATATTPTRTEADVSISKDAVDTVAVAGTEMTWALEVTNAGPSVARNVVVTDTLAPGLTGVSATPAECTTSAASFSCVFAVVEVGETIGITLVTAVAADQTEPVTNTATVTSDTPDTDDSNNQSAVVEVPVGLVADLVIDKTSAPNPVIPGQPITYTLVVTNNGPSTVTGARVSDTPPAEAVEPVATCAVDPAEGACTESTIFPEISFLVDLAPGASATITIDALVDPAAVAGFLNTATVTAPAGVTDPIPENNINDDGNDASPVVLTDLSLTKVSTPNPAVAGEPITYTMVVTNGGPSTAAGATIADDIPASVLNPTAVCDVAAQDGACSLSLAGNTLVGQYTLNPGASLTVTVEGVIDAGQTSTITNSATVSPGPGATDPDDTDNTATDVSSPQVSADVFVTKVADQAAAVAGETMSWTVSVGNNGPSTATGVSVTESVPAGVTLVGEPDNCTDGVCTVGNLAVGESVDLVFETLIDAGLTTPVVNQASVTSTSPDPDPTNDNVATDPLPIDSVTDLSLVKTSSPDPVVAGIDLTYTIVVTNAGPSDAVGATVTDAVPSEVRDPVAACATVPATAMCSVTETGQNAGFDVSLPAGESITVTITGVVDSSFTGSIENVATVAPGPGASDPSPGNNSGININPSSGSADLSVLKTLTSGQPQFGSAIEWVIEVENAGPSTATGARVVDMLPDGVTDIEWSCNAATGVAACADGEGSGDVDVVVDLMTGSVIEITVRGVVSARDADLTNTATVTLPPGITDPNPDNNDASVDAIVRTPIFVPSPALDLPDFTPLEGVPAVPVTPTATERPLALTGTESNHVAALGLLMILAGSMLVIGHRRRLLRAEL